MTDLDKQHIDALERENDVLRERIRLLEAEIMGTDWHCPLEFGLTPAEQRILAALVARERCTKEFLLLATARPGTEPDTEIKIVDVFVCKARKKLAPFGIEILTLWGSGYALSDATRNHLRDWKDRAA